MKRRIRMAKDNRSEVAERLRKTVGEKQYMWRLKRGLNIKHKYLKA